MSDEAEAKKLIDGLAMVFAFALFVASVPLEGLVIAKAWLWFVVPFDVPAIRWVHGSAMSVTVALLIWRYRELTPEEREPLHALKRVASLYGVIGFIFGVLLLLRLAL